VSRRSHGTVLATVQCMEPVRVWAPAASRVDLVIDGRRAPMAREAGGWFRGPVLDAGID